MTSAYIIAARRTALGRVGGLHKMRRLADLTAPVVTAALADASLDAQRVDELVLGNVTEGGNPARLVALSSGLPESTTALTIDRQCSSGLDAILAAARTIRCGEAGVMVAGGAESLSTAPWRIARPRSPFHVPHFVPLGQTDNGSEAASDRFQPTDELAARLAISRSDQDQWVAASFERALAAREAGRFLNEIVALRHNAEELRDQSTVDVEREDFADLTPFSPPNGTATPGNTAALHDGASVAVIVSAAVWEELGRPPALRVVAAASVAVSPAREAEAPIFAFKRLMERSNGIKAADIGAIELNEASATQALAFLKESGIDAARLNCEGGAIARGHALSASGAVAAARLFTRMVRSGDPSAPTIGVAALGTVGGLGVAAMVERV